MILKRCHDCGKPTRDGKGRCPACRSIRRDADRERNRAIAEALFPPTVRTKLLAMLRSGVPLGEACTDLGVNTVRVYGWRAHDPAWSARLDGALMEGRDPELTHGTADTYRWYGCRCPECRTANRSPGA